MSLEDSNSPSESASEPASPNGHHWTLLAMKETEETESESSSSSSSGVSSISVIVAVRALFRFVLLSTGLSVFSLPFPGLSLLFEFPLNSGQPQFVLCRPFFLQC